MTPTIEHLRAETALLRAEFEAVASECGIPLTTLGAKVGQGGHFHKRLAAGKWMWPETIENVQRRLQEIRAKSAREPSHGRDGPGVQGDAA